MSRRKHKKQSIDRRKTYRCTKCAQEHLHFHFEFSRASQPRCTACGGRLEFERQPGTMRMMTGLTGAQRKIYNANVASLFK